MIGVLIFFGIVLIIVLAAQGNKRETVTRIDEAGNRTVETREAEQPGAGTVAARVVLGIIGAVVAFVFLFALICNIIY